MVPPHLRRRQLPQFPARLRERARISLCDTHIVVPAIRLHLEAGTQYAHDVSALLVRWI
jgi:hypothetical protein